jgi:uncharacterized protein
MRVQRCGDAGEWLERGEGVLLAEEALHARMLGIGGALAERPEEDADLLVVVDVGDRVAVAALRTPPWPLQVSAGPGEAIEALVRHLAAERPDLAGVIGPAEAAERFASAWVGNTGAAVTPGMATRCFTCRQVSHPAGVDGVLRGAARRDRHLLLVWLKAFHDEAVPDDPVTDFGPVVDRWLAAPPERGGFWLWEAGGQVVAMAGTTGATPNGIRILSVYTPPPLRGRGYASALVAAVTQQELDRGRGMVFLSTDLANPTSNRIYRAIGYEAVGDERSFRFHLTWGA